MKLFTFVRVAVHESHAFAAPPVILPLQLPSEKFQKSHKKFRMFDKDNDHHIGTSTSPFELFVKSSK
jgi:hypothetical protein